MDINTNANKKKKPIISKSCVKSILDAKFIRVFDLQYAENKHYYDATRHTENELTATKSDEEFKSALPDAVTCYVIIKSANDEPRLLLFYEYRYPTGQFLLSPPAGLIDPEDKHAKAPLLETAKREIYEETGITVSEKDQLYVVNPLAFSSPGMTDESNALVCAVVHLDDLSALSQKGAVGSEVFDGFALLTKKEAKEILLRGTDGKNGNFFSLMTWSALLYFVSGIWEES